MKRSFLVICACAIALMACKKEPAMVPALTTAYEDEVLVEAAGDIITVDFEVNTNWTAKLDVDGTVANLSAEAGTKEEAKVKLTVLPMDEEVGYRVINLTLTPEGGEPSVIKFVQHAKFVVSEYNFSVGKEGGSVQLSVYTSLEYKYEAQEGLEVSRDGIHYTLTAPASTTWSVTSYRIKFTVPSIQDDVLDDNGDPTGETEDHTERAYVWVEGYATMAYESDITAYMTESQRLTIATAGDNLLLCNGKEVYSFNKDNGAYVDKISEGVWAIANDDAGNIVAATGSGAYTATLQLVAIPAASFTDQTTYKPLNSYANGFYGFGLDNMTVRGNILSGDAVITFCSGGAPGSFILFFQYKDGVFQGPEGSHTDFVTLTNLAEISIWDSKHIAAICTTTKFDAGILYSGYDSIYDIWYNPGTSGANWASVDSGYGDSSMAITSMDIVNWNGKDILVAGGLSFFSCWYCPSYLFIVDVTDPAAPVYLDSIEYTTNRITPDYLTYYTNHVQAEVVGSDLVVYLVDGDYYTLAKVVFPKDHNQ